MVERSPAWYDHHYSRRKFALRVPGDALKDRQIQRAIAARGCRMVLDLGCGEGHTCEGLDKKARVVGIDFSRFALSRAQWNGLTDLVLGDACNLPFADGSFDCIIAKDLLEHVANDSQIVDEISRVSRPGAWVLLYLPREFNPPNFSTEALVKALTGYTLDEDVGHLRRYTPKLANELLNARGYRIQEVWNFVHFTLGFVSLAAVLGNRLLSSGGQPGQSGAAFHAVAAIFKAIEVIGGMEAMLMRRLPGAGFFVLAKKVM